MFIKKLIKISALKKNFLLAFSGGVDSTVLLYQLIKINKKKQNIQIRAIHINHNLNPQAITFQQHCENICRINQIEIIIKNIFIPKNTKYGIEGYARKKRYEIFQKTILPTEILLTAHNLNDQCENLFLSLKRSSSINGLSGIQFDSQFNKMQIIRPLIYTSKKKITLWAKKKKISWIEDLSNKCIQYDRNFLRNKVLKKIYERWPYFLKNCTNSMFLLSKDQKVLNFFLLQFLKKNIFLDQSLSLLNFNNLTKETKFAILKKWLEKFSKQIPSYHILKRIYAEIVTSEEFHNKKIIFYKYEIKRFKKRIYAIIPNNKIKNIIIPWKNMLIPLILPDNLGVLIANIEKNNAAKNQNKIIRIPYPEKNIAVNIRFKIKKKYIYSDKKIFKIKKIWQKNNIPPWLRNSIPLLFYNKKLISGIGFFKMKNVLDNNLQYSKYITITWINHI